MMKIATNADPGSFAHYWPIAVQVLIVYPSASNRNKPDVALMPFVGSDRLKFLQVDVLKYTKARSNKRF